MQAVAGHSFRNTPTIIDYAVTRADGRNPPFTDDKEAGCVFRLHPSSYGGQVGTSAEAWPRPLALTEEGLICPTGKSVNCCPAPIEKIFRFAADPNQN